jgi:uncharacterized protein
MKRLFPPCAFIVFIAIPCLAGGASFDCRKATTQVEKQICASSDLSKLDTDLTRAYLYASLEVSDPQQLKTEQRAWIKKRDECPNQTPACAIALYRSRIAELRNLLGDCDRGTEPDMAGCESEKQLGAYEEMQSLIAQMRVQLFNPQPELVAQPAWEEYRDKECQSRASEGGSLGGEQYQQCLLEFTKARISDLRTYHFCDSYGCPRKKSALD